MNRDEIFLARAFELALRGRFTTAPNPNVGCVIVRNAHIVGEGYHQRAGEPHAEVNALLMAGDAARGATVYVTLEPCNHQGRTPSCADALICAGVVRVVAAMRDPNPEVSGRGFYRLRQAGVEVREGLMSTRAENINLGFLKRMRTGLPWVRLKLAASLDGRTAMASGESQWITSSEARRDVQCWRAESDAILTTASTVIADDPELTVRWSLLPEDVKVLYPQDLVRQPVRVIIDSANRVTLGHRVIHGKGVIWLARLKPDTILWPSSVEQLKLPSILKDGVIHVNLMALMVQLGYRQINNLWVEAGAGLAGALLSIGLVDEFVLYQAPKLLGADARPLCLLSSIKHLSAVPTFNLLDVRQIGPDIRLIMKPDYLTTSNI